MTLVFKSTIAEVFQIIGRDVDGSKRVATATRVEGNRWDLEYQFPSGRGWKGQFHGPNILDGLSQMVTDREAEYKQEKARGHKPEPAIRDKSRSVPEYGNEPDIVRTDRYSIPPRR